MNLDKLRNVLNELNCERKAIAEVEEMNSPHKRDGNYYTERKDYNQFQEDDPNYENYEDLKSKSEFFFFYSLNNNFRIIYCLFPQTLNIFFFFNLAS